MKLLEVFQIINESQFLVERDVMNAKELKQWSREQAARVQNPPEQNWFASQLFKYLINRYDNYEQVTSFNDGAPEWLQAKIQAGEPVIWVVPTDELNAQIQGVIDWLNAEPQNNLRMSWEDAVEAQAEWHDDMARASRVSKLTAEEMEGIVTIMEFPDGYKWVDVQTEVCLKHEGTLMGHCVGQGGYTQGVKEGTTKILSLRDANDNPHATIEGTSENPIIITPEMVNSGQLDMFADKAVEQSFIHLTINQIKGKQNKPVVRKYRDYVQTFLTKFQITDFTGWGGLTDLEGSGLFKRRDGGFVTVEDAGEQMAKMDDGSVWERVSDKEVELSDYSGKLAAKWSLFDSAGRSIGTMTERDVGVIYSISGIEDARYKEHIKKVFDAGAKPNEVLYTSFYNSLEKVGLGVNNGKVGEPQDIGVKKGSTSSGVIYATEQAQHPGDVYWLIDNGKIQSRFRINESDAVKYIMILDDNRGLPKGSMPKFLKQVEAMFPDVHIGAIQIGNSSILADEIEWKDHQGDAELILEEDGVKFYSRGESISGAKWYDGVDAHGHHIFNMSIGDSQFKTRYVKNKSVAGFYAIYLLEHLEQEGEEEDIGDKGNYSSFAREFLNETWWFQSDYVRGRTPLSHRANVWQVMDEDYPIKLTVTHYYDDDTEENVIDEEETTMKQYWAETQLWDSGMEEDYFASEYDRIYAGQRIGWDDERDGYGDEEGDGPTLTLEETIAEGIGDDNTVTHPVSGGSVSVKS